MWETQPMKKNLCDSNIAIIQIILYIYKRERERDLVRLNQ